MKAVEVRVLTGLLALCSAAAGAFEIAGLRPDLRRPTPPPGPFRDELVEYRDNGMIFRGVRLLGAAGFMIVFMFLTFFVTPPPE